MALLRISSWSQDDLRGNRLGLPTLDQDRLLSPRLPKPGLGCPGSWAAAFAPSSRKAGGFRWAFVLSRLFFQYKQLRTVYVGSSTGVYFLVLLLALKRRGVFFPL